MLPKTVIKQIRSLSLKKIRNQEKLFVVEGVKMVEEALRSEYVIREIYTLDAASFPNATIVTPLEMAQITHFSTPSPALALLEQAQNLESDTPFLERGTLYLGLEAIRDPGNLGTIIRIADWFGIHKIFASTDTAELYNPKVIQATMGSLFRVTVVYADLNTLLSRTDVPVWGALLEGKSIYQTDLSSNGIVLIGNESHGLSPQLKEKINHPLFIPRYPLQSAGAESLNAAVATAIICAAFRKG